MTPTSDTIPAIPLGKEFVLGEPGTDNCGGGGGGNDLLRIDSARECALASMSLGKTPYHGAGEWENAPRGCVFDARGAFINRHETGGCIGTCLELGMTPICVRSLDVLHLRLIDRTEDCSTLQQGDLNKRWNSEVVVCDGCSELSGYLLASNPHYAERIDSIGLRPFLQPCGSEDEEDSDPSSNAQARWKSKRNSYDLMMECQSPGPYIGLLLQPLRLVWPSPAVRAARSSEERRSWAT